MKGFNLAVAAFGRTPRLLPRERLWTCRQCLQQSSNLQIGNQVRGYARKGNTYGGGAKSARSKRRAGVLMAAAGGALGVTAVAFTDDVKHAYGAAERTGRVASTLAVCINE